MKHRKLFITGAACTVALSGVVAGCGGDEKSSSSGSSTAQSSDSGEKATAGTVVDIKDIKFQPEDVTVKLGEEITWTNSDTIAHTVTANSGADFDSGSIDGGEDYTWKADKAGKIEYLCSLHPGQAGTITVTQ